MRRLWPVGILLLQACGQPDFSLRGYTNLSDCRTVIDTELANGAEFVSAFDTDVSGPQEGAVTQLSTSLLETPVAIYVDCAGNGKVRSIDYIANQQDLGASSRFFDGVAGQIGELFGTATATESPTMRSRTYFCDDRGMISLRQAKHDEQDFEVSLLVVPVPSRC
jgi:hypothetical protein